MGLWNLLSICRRSLWSARLSEAAQHTGTTIRKSGGRTIRVDEASRRCRFETMEDRQMMDADPIKLGVVYIEEDSGSDLHGDTFELMFEGGAAGTELTRLVIDTDHGPVGRSVGDLFFDTIKGGWGADEAFPMQIVSQTGIQEVTWTVEDGGTRLVLNFKGFNAGEKLRFSIDVDEVQDYDPSETNINIHNESVDPITSGVEFQGSISTATFKAPHYFDVEGAREFRNVYDTQFAGTNLLKSSGNANGLPQDDFEGKRDRSTGVMVPLQQIEKPITIAGKVFLDYDADLTQDAGDTGIGNVTMSLWKKVGNNYVFTGHTTKTNAQGEYEFGLDLKLETGTYQVREQQPDEYFSVGAIVGLVQGVKTGNLVGGDPDQLTEIAMPLGDTHGIRYDFAETLPASISGLVRLTDKFGNCEAAGVATRPIEGATVLLKDKQGNIIKQTLTNAQGKYEFTGLRPGEYTIVEITPPGLIDGGDHVGTVDGVKTGTVVENDTIDVSLRGGDDGINYDFCEKEPAMVSGYVYHDRDNDGIREQGEETIPGTTIILLDAGGTQIATQVTDQNGFYKFTGLGAGTYMIVEVQPTGWSDGKDTPGTIGGVTVGTATNDKQNNVVLLNGDNGIEYNFGELKTVSLSGYVHEDPIRNCIFDPGEKPISGVTITLYDANGVQLATTITDQNGFYKFDNLAPGTYMVRETQPVDYIHGGQEPGNLGGLESKDELSQIAIPSGQNATDYNFCEILPVSIDGYVHEDPIRNCIFDPGEKPISGVKITLYDVSNNVLATTYTDQNGYYKFDKLPPGTYTVRQTQPAGYFHGGQEIGSHGGVESAPDELSQITLESGDNAVNYNFCEVLPARLSGYVWVDTLPDCIFQPEEQPLSGVTINLYDEFGAIVATTHTNSQGYYEFLNLKPGQYTVKETQPTGYFQGGQMAGSEGGDDLSQDVIADVTLESGDNATRYDFCEVPPASLSGYVFQDGPAIPTNGSTPPANLYDIRDGQLTPDDQRISGVILELRHTLTGEVVDMSETLHGGSGAYRLATDSDGFYKFDGLRGGNYTVIEVHPSGYFDSRDTAGTTTGLAVNVNTTVDPLTIFIFEAAGVNFQFDAILRIPLAAGQESLFNNFSEVKITPTIIPPPPPPPPVPPPEPPFVLPPPPLDPAPLLFIPPPVAEQSITGGDAGWTWHLSIIDAGSPRISERSTRISDKVFRPALFVDQIQWDSERLRKGIWTIHNEAVEGEAGQTRVYAFGIPDGIPVVGDWNGDGKSELGIYYKGEWFLDVNGNGVWDEGDLWAKLGTEADKPVVGDWDGDGKDDIGIFGPEWPMDPRHIKHEPGLPDPHNIPRERQKNVPPKPEEATEGDRLLQLSKHGKERADLIDHVFQFGVATDIPIAGDWNGDGIRSIGVYRDGKWHFDMDGDGRWSKGDETARFGEKGDLPVVGDFNGDGIEEIGIFRNGKWIVDMNGNREIDAADRVFELGGNGDLPVVGDFNGDGIDEPQLYRQGELQVETSFEVPQQ
ncbi:Serine-aspartate repeat-containing protein D precursor [Anatilimnocola aggregata]|uniref:Serine-aspartate repeat-containing protein D n=1 Tax=Anatilimnocola aggregata TaxID=2528021 RepID=A0A517Y4I3_9BACT|nr:SdrD B-like domain-containing protein [Anatilimnocola aggregata]QDU25163.1 Serine-aspartate repeat-containing protein D precursor [Anatilimnocola aggregata]